MELNRYGNELNPILRLPDSSPRELISRCIDIICKNDDEIASKIPDLGKVRGDSYYAKEDNIFILNIITNQNLSPDAMRLGCFLSIQDNMFEDLAFDLSPIGKKFKDKNIADGETVDYLYIVSHSSHKPDYIDLPCRNILKLLYDSGIIMCRDDLIRAIIELHEFYYITATDICFENSLDEYRKNKTRKKISIDSNLVHIHLTTAMKSVPLTNKWLSFVKPTQ